MKIFIITSLLLSSAGSKAQNLVDVAEGTLKISGMGEEVFYYGFAEGDQMIFSFNEMNGKELKEIEITELPSSVKFMDYKSKRIENKTILVARTGIYRFRFSNSALLGRICRFKLQRIPASEAKRNFNCAVFWRSVNDTSYVPVTEKYLVRSDTNAIMVTEQLAKVSSKNIIDFTLPPNTAYWSFYIGVGKEGKAAYDAARDKFINSASKAVFAVPGIGAMAALALQGINYFNKVSGSDNVEYYFIRDWENVRAFEEGRTFYQYKQGNVVNDASQIRSPLQGKIYLGLYNSKLRSIEVVVKVCAVTIFRQWDTRQVIEMKVRQRQEAYLNN